MAKKRASVDLFAQLHVPGEAVTLLGPTLVAGIDEVAKWDQDLKREVEGEPGGDPATVCRNSGSPRRKA